MDRSAAEALAAFWTACSRCVIDVASSRGLFFASLPGDGPRLAPQAIANARLTAGLPGEISALASGSHPLAALLRLVESSAGLDDDEWTRLHREVATAFGRPLASAAIRGRLELSHVSVPVVSINGKPSAASGARDVRMP